MKIPVYPFLLGVLLLASCSRGTVEPVATPADEGRGKELEAPSVATGNAAPEESAPPRDDGKVDLSKRTVKSALPPVPALPEDGPPIAEKVSGMSGYVISPFAEGKKIEVVGYPRGTVVKCPYTQKEFRVP